MSSEDLFKCRMCQGIKDTTEKNRLTVSKWSTKATAKGTVCDKCFTQVVNKLAEIGLKLGEWKEWPKRSKGGD